MAFLHLRAVAAAPLVLLLLVSHAAAWSMTQYLMTSTSTWPGQSTASTLTTTVTPTGSVKPIASNTTTITYANTSLEDYIAEPYSFVLTLTNLILAHDASACATSLDNASFTCMPSSTSTASPTITTRIFAPLVIQNPSSCTKTSFSYTSSTILYFNLIGLPFYTALQAQAPDSAEAVFVTTFVVTLSTDLGGQPVTTSYADIYLSTGAVSGLTPGGGLASFLEQCVDPSSSLCTSTPKVTDLLQCTKGVSITYPNKAPSEGGGTTTGGASTSPPSPTTSKNDAESLFRPRRAEFVLGLAGLAAAYLVL